MAKKMCDVCKREFSAHLINDLAIADKAGLKYIPMCPICGLDEMGKASFSEGSRAQSLHKEALKEVEQMRRNK